MDGEVKARGYGLAGLNKTMIRTASRGVDENNTHRTEVWSRKQYLWQGGWPLSQLAKEVKEEWVLSTWENKSMERMRLRELDKADTHRTEQ